MRDTDLAAFALLIRFAAAQGDGTAFGTKGQIIDLEGDQLATAEGAGEAEPGKAEGGESPKE